MDGQVPSPADQSGPSTPIIVTALLALPTALYGLWFLVAGLRDLGGFLSDVVIYFGLCLLGAVAAAVGLAAFGVRLRRTHRRVGVVLLAVAMLGAAVPSVLMIFNFLI